MGQPCGQPFGKLPLKMYWDHHLDPYLSARWSFQTGIAQLFCPTKMGVPVRGLPLKELNPATKMISSVAYGK